MQWEGEGIRIRENRIGGRPWKQGSPEPTILFFILGRVLPRRAGVQERPRRSPQAQAPLDHLPQGQAELLGPGGVSLPLRRDTGEEVS